MAEQSAMTHWRVSAAVCMMMLGTYFIYDIPASLSISLADHLSLSDHQYTYLLSILYTVYSTPNTVLPFLSGAAVERFGERAVLLFTIASIVTGQLLFALGVQTKLQLGMIVGRACIGLGGEVVSVLGCDITTRWFQDKRLSLALAMNLGAGRLGSVANSMLIPRAVGKYGVVSATWGGTLLSLVVSTISVIFLAAATNPKPAADPQVKTEETDSAASLPFHRFPGVYWQLALICFLGYGGLNTFTNSAQRFIATRYYHGDQRAGGSAISVLYVLSGILVTPFGLMLDMIQSAGYPRALIAGNMLMILVHSIFLANVGLGPILPLCLLGISEALFAVAFWAGVARCLLLTAARARVVKDMSHKSVYDPILSDVEDVAVYHERGEEPVDQRDNVNVHGEAIRILGLGIMTSLMNISTATVPALLAVMENVAGFSGLEAVFLALAVLGYMASVRLAWMWDEDE